MKNVVRWAMSTSASHRGITEKSQKKNSACHGGVCGQYSILWMISLVCASMINET